MPLPPAAEALATDRLAAVDAAAPGLVTAWWVTGSAASGDWWPAVSDVDVVAATSREPTDDDLAALAAVHPTGAGPDVVYVPAAALATDPPSAEEPAPHVVGGEFGTGPCGACTPVTWLELRLRGVALRGPAPTEAVAAPDPAVLRAWLLGNLRGYWAGQADAWEPVLAARPDDAPAAPEGVLWLALGAPRLHATLVTGDVLTKTEAGEYVARLLPEHADLAQRCVAARAGLDVTFDTVDGREAVALVRAVVAAAETLPPA